MEVAIPSRASTHSQQVNITLDSHWRLVLRVVAEADGVSVPEVLRPVVMRYLKRRMQDEDLREAVSRIESLRRARNRVPDNITSLPGTRRTDGKRVSGRRQVRSRDGSDAES